MKINKETISEFFKKKGLIPLIIKYAVCIVMTAILIVGTNIAFYYEMEINTVLAPPIVDETKLNQATAEGQKMSARIMEEGTVLLKNENSTLPLNVDTDGKVNVFGWHSVDWLYGTGGGSASSGGVLPEDGDFSKNIDFLKALNEYGIEYNEELTSMYKKYFKPFYLASGWKSGNFVEAQKLVEPDINDKTYYSDTLLKNAKEYSDTAIMVISRLCGENSGNPKNQPKNGPNGATTDSTRHYLELSTEEEALLTYLGTNFKNVIVLINNCNQMELGLLETIPGIDACMYVGYTGTRGAVGIPKLLYGETSPSGRLVDTFAYDLFTNPSVIWGTTPYEDGGWHMDKVAGIYLGYKWYETADVMGLWSAENGYEKGYEGVVQYPFGYGLSYTDFEWTVDDIKVDEKSVAKGAEIKENSKIEFTVTVKNTGEAKGREVVEIFGTAPYTNGEIEKSAVELVGYGKTNELDPGASETIKVTVDMYDIASYDCYDKNNDGHTGYELDKGEYVFKLSKNSHVVNTVNYNGKAEKGEFNFNLAETKHIDKDPVTKQTVKNLFTGDDAVDIVPIDDTTETFTPDIPWITRAGLKTPKEITELYNNSKRQKNPKLEGYDKTSSARWAEWDKETVDVFGNEVNQTKPTWGASGDKKLAVNGVITDLGKKLGADYNAPEWEEVLNQITFNEAYAEINRYYGSKAIDSVGKPKLTDLDGPTQVKGYNQAPRGTGYPSMVVIAQTWNQELAYEYGQSFGTDMKAVGVSGLWGFACDLHIDAFFGRNNESPSEDPFLAGTTMAKAVSGVNTRGRYTFLKHFAVYQSGIDKTFMSEQTFRETHLKAFRKAFVDGGALGAMMSYQSVGAEISEYSQGLITGVLRGEWQFKGAITTDANMEVHYKLEGLIRCGGNFGMGMELGRTGITYSVSSTTGRMQNRMREAMHQILYTWLHADYNERVYLETAQDKSYISSTSINSWEWWKPFIISLDVVIGCVMLFWLISATTGFVEKNRKEENAAC